MSKRAYLVVAGIIMIYAIIMYTLEVDAIHSKSVALRVFLSILICGPFMAACTLLIWDVFRSSWKRRSAANKRSTTS